MSSASLERKSRRDSTASVKYRFNRARSKSVSTLVNVPRDRHESSFLPDMCTTHVKYEKETKAICVFYGTYPEKDSRKNVGDSSSFRSIFDINSYRFLAQRTSSKEYPKDVLRTSLDQCYVG